MSGHFATLLRDTVRTVLQDHDVYVTDWHNVRDVPLAAGRFGLDEYTEHLIDFLAAMGPGANVIAVCQPCVAALARGRADVGRRPPGHAGQPDADGRPDRLPHQPDRGQQARDDQADRLVREEPDQPRAAGATRGGGRRVYPGFVQLSAFMSMNKERHVNAFKDYYRHLVDDEFDKAEVTRTFYEEYMAVADLPAEFYLETVEPGVPGVRAAARAS